MPPATAYREALLNDPEVAEQIAAKAPDGPPARPEWSTYTPERAALDNILDRLGDVVTAVVGAAGAKRPPTYPQSLRPTTEVDRARLRRERAAHDGLVADVMAAQERWERRRREE